MGLSPDCGERGRTGGASGGVEPLNHNEDLAGAEECEVWALPPGAKIELWRKLALEVIQEAPSRTASIFSIAKDGHGYLLVYDTSLMNRFGARAPARTTTMPVQVATGRTLIYRAQAPPWPCKIGYSFVQEIGGPCPIIHYLVESLESQKETAPASACNGMHRSGVTSRRKNSIRRRQDMASEGSDAVMNPELLDKTEAKKIALKRRIIVSPEKEDAERGMPLQQPANEILVERTLVGKLWFVLQDAGVKCLRGNSPGTRSAQISQVGREQEEWTHTGGQNLRVLKITSRPLDYWRDLALCAQNVVLGSAVPAGYPVHRALRADVVAGDCMHGKGTRSMSKLAIQHARRPFNLSGLGAAIPRGRACGANHVERVARRIVLDARVEKRLGRELEGDKDGLAGLRTLQRLLRRRRGSRDDLGVRESTFVWGGIVVGKEKIFVTSLARVGARRSMARVEPYLAALRGFRDRPVPFAALSALCNPYRDGSGDVYVLRRVPHAVQKAYDTKKISRASYLAKTQVKLGHSQDFPTRQRGYRKCAIDWVLLWQVRFSTPNRKLLEALVHESLRERDASVEPVECSCSVRHTEFFDLKRAGGVRGVELLVLSWMWALGQAETVRLRIWNATSFRYASFLGCDRTSAGVSRGANEGRALSERGTHGRMRLPAEEGDGEMGTGSSAQKRRPPSSLGRAYPTANTVNAWQNGQLKQTSEGRHGTDCLDSGGADCNIPRAARRGTR
ncbi:hypothetical protein DFH06DRAFT_1149011 [Mycena polygramma]|nr:hypothetical protein DFH06DRAFT_1149011 [Mycena polygramma]